MTQPSAVHFVHQFNWLPVSYCHTSWFDPWISSDVAIRLLEQPEVARTLNRFLLRNRPVSGQVTEDACADPLVRLFLLPPNVIARTVLYLGLVGESQNIRRVISGIEQRRIKEQLGEDAYAFTITRAPLIGKSAAELLPDETPVDGNTNYFKRSRARGLSLFALATQSVDAHVRTRGLYKFNKQDANTIESIWNPESGKAQKRVITDLDEANQTHSLLFKLVREVFPEWQTFLV